MGLQLFQSVRLMITSLQLSECCVSSLSPSHIDEFDSHYFEVKGYMFLWLRGEYRFFLDFSHSKFF